MSQINLIIVILAIGFSCTKAQLNSSDIAVKNSGGDDKIPLTNIANSNTNLNVTSSNPEDIAEDNSTNTKYSTTPQPERTNETSTTKFEKKQIPSMDIAHSTSTQNSTSRNHGDIAKENSTETINSTTPQLERTNETSTTKFGEKGVSEDRGSTVLSNSTTTADSNLNTTNIDLNMTKIHHKENGFHSTTEKVDGSRKTSPAKSNGTSHIQPKKVDGKGLDATTPLEIDIKTHSFPYWIILVSSLGLLVVGFSTFFALRTMRKSNQAERETELSVVRSVNTQFTE